MSIALLFITELDQEFIVYDFHDDGSMIKLESVSISLSIRKKNGHALLDVDRWLVMIEVFLYLAMEIKFIFNSYMEI